MRQTMTRQWGKVVRRLRESEWPILLPLLATSTLIGIGMAEFDLLVPVSVAVIPMVFAHILLSPRTLPWAVGYGLAVVVAVILSDPANQLDKRRLVGVVVVFAVGLLIILSSRGRSRLGVAGNMGESMLVDLRERISKQGRMPELPATWYAEAVMRSAGASSFAGDFMVAALSPDRRKLQVVVVDVSGKGEQAGTRALLLSGAFGGLLNALPADSFLPAANDYLMRQDWGEGFATAVHLALDLGTGAFELRSAGHPPAVQLNAGSGRWVVHETEGPVLGLVPDAKFASVIGTVQRGDALLLYTDGLVETPQRDISLGIDKLLGQGERLLRMGFEHGAERLIDRLESMNDDRALLLLHRR
jgi:hypothetical protein